MKRMALMSVAVAFLAGLALPGASQASDGGRSATVRVFTDDFSLSVGDPGHWRSGPRDGRHYRGPERHGPYRGYRDDHRWRRGEGFWIDAWFGPPRHREWNRPYPDYLRPDGPYRYLEPDRHRQYVTRIWVAGRMTGNGYVPGYWKIVPLGGGEREASEDREPY